MTPLRKRQEFIARLASRLQSDETADNTSDRPVQGPETGPAAPFQPWDDDDFSAFEGEDGDTADFSDAAGEPPMDDTVFLAPRLDFTPGGLSEEGRDADIASPFADGKVSRPTNRKLMSPVRAAGRRLRRSPPADGAEPATAPSPAGRAPVGMDGDTPPDRPYEHGTWAREPADREPSEGSRPPWQREVPPISESPDPMPPSPAAGRVPAPVDGIHTGGRGEGDTPDGLPPLSPVLSFDDDGPERRPMPRTPRSAAHGGPPAGALEDHVSEIGQTAPQPSAGGGFAVKARLSPIGIAWSARFRALGQGLSRGASAWTSRARGVTARWWIAALRLGKVGWLMLVRAVRASVTFAGVAGRRIRTAAGAGYAASRQGVGQAMTAAKPRLNGAAQTAGSALIAAGRGTAGALRSAIQSSRQGIGKALARGASIRWPGGSDKLSGSGQARHGRAAGQARDDGFQPILPDKAPLPHVPGPAIDTCLAMAAHLSRADGRTSAVEGAGRPNRLKALLDHRSWRRRGEALVAALGMHRARIAGVAAALGVMAIPVLTAALMPEAARTERVYSIPDRPLDTARSSPDGAGDSGSSVSTGGLPPQSVADDALADMAGYVEKRADIFQSSADANDILKRASAEEGLEQFVQAAELVGLERLLEPGETYTIFAPHDDAFAKLGAVEMAGLLSADGHERLLTILSHHVLRERLTGSDLTGGAKEYVSLADQTMTVQVDDRIRIGDAAMIQADLETKNGILHVIDTILTVPAP